VIEIGNEQPPPRRVIDGNSSQLVRQRSVRSAQEPPSAEEAEDGSPIRLGRRSSSALAERKFERCVLHTAVHELKIERLRAEIDAEKYKECTFSPKWAVPRRGKGKKVAAKNVNGNE
jgi:hypothetical protein